MRSCYEPMVKSLIKCYNFYKNEVYIAKYIEVERVLSHFNISLTRDKFCRISTKITDIAADSDRDDKECFIKALQEEIPEFIEKFTDYLTLQDCPNHSKLYHHLQKSEVEILPITSLINYLPGIKRYQEYLKNLYLEKVEVEVQDTFNNNIHQFKFN